jgi:hypothetical protein
MVVFPHIKKLILALVLKIGIAIGQNVLITARQAIA